MVTGAGEGVGGDGLVLGQRFLGQGRPRDRGRWVRAATMAGFWLARSSASASRSPGSRIGSGPKRSRVGAISAAPPHHSRASSPAVTGFIVPLCGAALSSGTSNAFQGR
ncbi:hypothetical protein I552_7416 [Mycobacterium xenopi 3993]|nr:hypothetical protein I552_7416 [Mycobacterium xenopi 3993]